MPSSVVQRVLLKICEERREVSGDLSDFIISDRAHRWSREGRPAMALVMWRPLEPQIPNPDVPVCWGLSRNPPRSVQPGADVAVLKPPAL